MAHALGISDGTTTVSLSTTNFLMLHYVPMSPSYKNGTYADVVDSIELMTDTASATASQAAIHSIEQLLSSAIRRQETQTGPRVFLELTLDGGSEYRSEILNGQIVLGNDALRTWGQAKYPLTFVVTRVPYWEGALTQIVTSQTLTNADGSNSYYTSTTVAGSMPTPCKIQLLNSSGGTQYPYHTHLGVNAFNVPATFDGTLGAESFTITAPRTFADVALASWFPSSADWIAMNGDYWRFVGAFTGGATANVFYRMDVTSNTYANTLFTTDEIYSNGYLYTLDFGTMRTPNIIGGISVTGTNIILKVATEATSGADVLTFEQMFPANNYRYLSMIGALGNGDALIDDGIEGDAYVDNGSTNLPNLQAQGSPLMLYPGQAHRFSWLAGTATYQAALEQVLSVWYRPRRLTI